MTVWRRVWEDVHTDDAADDEKRQKALAQAVEEALLDGYTITGDPEWTVRTRSALAVLGELDRAEYDSDDAMFEAAKGTAERTCWLEVAFLVEPTEPDRPPATGLTDKGAAGLLGQAAQLIERQRRAIEAGDVVCGSPTLRHEFLGDAVKLRDGEIDAAVCRRCGTTCTREGLLALAEREAKGERWWE